MKMYGTLLYVITYEEWKITSRPLTNSPPPTTDNRQMPSSLTNLLCYFQQPKQMEHHFLLLHCKHFSELNAKCKSKYRPLWRRCSYLRVAHRALYFLMGHYNELWSSVAWAQNGEVILTPVQKCTARSVKMTSYFIYFTI